jgi:hypothetical protein
MPTNSKDYAYQRYLKEMRSPRSEAKAKNEPKPCTVCKKDFRPVSKFDRYCSQKCRGRAGTC